MNGEMTSSESLERVVEGLSRAASCCRELAKITDSLEWKDVSRQLLIMRQKVLGIYRGPSLTEAEVLVLVANMELAQRQARGMAVN